MIWRDGTYYLHIIQTHEVLPLKETHDVLGVDLGISNVATDSTGTQFTGTQVRLMRSRAVARRAALQRVGTRSAKRRLKQMRRRERRWMKHENHKITKTLVAKSALSSKALALEDQTDLREEITVRRADRYERHCWTFYQLRLFLTYKKAWADVPI